ncbi:MAG: hypothetical protein TR69_WS6001000250 [candidate division WS6 bacterium OLB20]|uniref:5' nucleotidase, deoxy (Pyrimidine), cytosolic type C protein (NT5C) n=1 Tax=candidate division WS6 bacterium OLB20 TaxID=1617426 RepID=A0A136M0E8_9BACT|nr:MAG: hypothetical protein TR69_WS6001000250 [candidate division WS6 bacterium OLB20]
MLSDITSLHSSLKQSGTRGIALDIDETLSHTVLYWFSRMQTLFGNPEDLSVEDMIRKYRYSYHVPYWQTPEVDEWIAVQLHSNQVQEELPVIKGATEGVNKINETIPVVAYLTARPDSVQDGTRTWLTMHGFPEVPLITRPPYVVPQQGNTWKAAVLSHIQDHVVGIIDDNPGLVEKLDEAYTGTVFLYDYSDTVNSSAEVISCKNWDAVVDAVISKYSGSGKT